MVATRLTGQVRALVQQASFGGQAVLLPSLLQMNEAPLPRTERKVLQAAERKVRVEIAIFRQTYLQAVTPDRG